MTDEPRVDLLIDGDNDCLGCGQSLVQHALQPDGAWVALEVPAVPRCRDLAAPAPRWQVKTVERSPHGDFVQLRDAEASDATVYLVHGGRRCAEGGLLRGPPSASLSVNAVLTRIAKRYAQRAGCITLGWPEMTAVGRWYEQRQQVRRNLRRMK